MAINNVTGPASLNVQTIDTDGDGAVDQGQIQKDTGSVSSFDSFNLKTSEGAEMSSLKISICHSENNSNFWKIILFG